MSADEIMEGLPGETLIRQGLADAALGRRTIAGYLVAIARPRLSRAGLLQPSQGPAIVDAELQLYRLLREEGGDAYSRYNSLLRELISFEQGLDHRLSRRGTREIPRTEDR